MNHIFDINGPLQDYPLTLDHLCNSSRQTLITPLNSNFFFQFHKGHIKIIFNTDNGTMIIFRLTVSGFLSILHLIGAQSLC